MGAAPAISVLLPVRDGAPFLAEALESLLAQDFDDFEVLVQDDGSRDASPAIARAFAARDERVRVQVGPWRGLVAALNAAAGRARGALLVRMDADDRSRSDRLARLHAHAAAHPDVGFLGSGVRFFPRGALRAGMRRYEAWLDGVRTHDDVVAQRFVECPLAHPTWAVRREVFARLGGYRDGPFPEDHEFLLRAADAGVRFARLPEPLLAWREHGARLSRTDPRYALARFFDLKLLFLVPWLREAGRPVAVVGAGRDGKRWARRLAAEGLPVTHLVDVHPRRIGQRIHGAQVVGYEDLDAVGACVLLGAVGTPDGRANVRARLAQAGRVEGRDFVCVQ